MKITKEFPGLVEESWCFRFAGSIQTQWSIEIDLGNKWLIVSGRIKAGWGIKAGAGIKAGGGIEAGWGIEAGLSITANWIQCRLRIFAGILGCRIPSTEEMRINAEVLEGIVAFGEVRHEQTTKNS